MPFMSYAQNYEDVILYRAFSNISEGTYIDVGAHDPEVDSVTKLFYDIGWRGINIEPVASGYDKLREARPDDINLKIAIGNEEGHIKFFEVVETGLSTVDEKIADRHARDQGKEVKRYDVPITRLSTVLAKHELSEIHFLKIDVEGAERHVIEGMNLEKTRPWVFIVESTLPNLQDESFEDWEPMLLAADYQFAYFDGLNRFYVAKEHEELCSKIAIPPNVFDDFNLSGTGNSPLHYQLAKIKSALTSASNQNSALIEERDQIRSHERKLENLIEEALETQIEKSKALLEAQEQVLSRQRELEAQIERCSLLEDAINGAEEARRSVELQLDLALTSIDQKERKLRIANERFEIEHELRKKHELSAQATHHALNHSDQALRNKHRQFEQLRQSNESLWREARDQIDLHRRALEAFRQALDVSQLETERLANQLRSVYASKSWQITSPLRRVQDGLMRALGRSTERSDRPTSTDPSNIGPTLPPVADIPADPMARIDASRWADQDEKPVRGMDEIATNRVLARIFEELERRDNSVNVEQSERQK